MKTFVQAAGLILILGLNLVAEAQRVVRAPVLEDFAPSVKVSGSVLVGAAIGSLAGSADPRKLVVPASTASAGASLCFTARTRDGQYTAEAHLSKQAVPSEDFFIEPEGSWKHLAALSAYSFGDFATLVRVSDDCAMNPKAPVMPVRYPSTGAPALFVFINSQRALSASVAVQWKDGRRATGACETFNAARERSTAFDMICTVSLPSAPEGEAELSIARRARMGPATDVVPLRMPTVAATLKGN